MLTVDVPVVVHVMGTAALGCRLPAVSVGRSAGKHEPAGYPVTGINYVKRVLPVRGTQAESNLFAQIVSKNTTIYIRVFLSNTKLNY